MRDKPRWEIIHGDSLTVLESFPPGTFDAVITDPPYASGGRTQAEKSKATAKKYSSMGGNAPPDFDGDAKDQRSWTRWAAEWLYLARRAAKPGAPVCMFIDWRQLPCASDALQWAGWIWRGIAVWDKGNSRPQKGRFREQAEYIVWGSNGDMPVSRPVPCLPGVFKYGNPQNRIHLTEKPLQLMQDLVKITEPGGHILDPFAGSGTTVLAAVKEGYDATGIEVTDVYADLARKRLEAELNEAAELVKATPATLSERIRALQKELKEVKSENESMKAKEAQASLGNVMDNVKEIKGVPFLCAHVPGVDMNELRSLGDDLKAKLSGGVVVLISDKDGKVNLVAMASEEAMKQGAHAGNLVKGIAKEVGGGGGGRPNMAQAGGKNPAGIGKALEEAEKVLEGQLS